MKQDPPLWYKLFRFLGIRPNQDRTIPGETHDYDDVVHDVDHGVYCWL